MNNFRKTKNIATKNRVAYTLFPLFTKLLRNPLNDSPVKRNNSGNDKYRNIEIRDLNIIFIDFFKQLVKLSESRITTANSSMMQPAKIISAYAYFT